MVDRRLPGRPPVLFASPAVQDINGLPAAAKGGLLAALERLRDVGSLPTERTLSGFSADQRVRAASLDNGYVVIFRDLTPEELSRQDKDDAANGVLVFAILPPTSSDATQTDIEGWLPEEEAP